MNREEERESSLLCLWVRCVCEIGVKQMHSMGTSAGQGPPMPVAGAKVCVLHWPAVALVMHVGIYLLKWADALILLLVIMTISCMLSFSSGLIATEFGGSISEGVAEASASIPDPGLLSRASGTMVDGSGGFGDATTGSPSSA